MTFFTVWSKTDWIAVIKPLRNEIMWLLPLCLIIVNGIEVNYERIIFLYRYVPYLGILREAKQGSSNCWRLDSKRFLHHMIQILKVLSCF